MRRNVYGLALCAMLFALSYSASAQQAVKVPRIGFLARIIHGFWKSCEELASLAKRFQFRLSNVEFRASRDTEVADLVIERGKNAFLENTPALVCCDFLDSGRLFFASGA